MLIDVITSLSEDLSLLSFAFKHLIKRQRDKKTPR